MHQRTAPVVIPDTSDDCLGERLRRWETAGTSARSTATTPSRTSRASATSASTESAQAAVAVACARRTACCASRVSASSWARRASARTVGNQSGTSQRGVGNHHAAIARSGSQPRGQHAQPRCHRLAAPLRHHFHPVPAYCRLQPAQSRDYNVIQGCFGPFSLTWDRRDGSGGSLAAPAAVAPESLG